MGNVLRRDPEQLKTLECQLGAAQAHPALGFVAELDAKFVGDLSRQDAKGRPKWKLLRPNACTVVLNPDYDLSPEECAVHKLWFLYQTLQDGHGQAQPGLRDQSLRDQSLRDFFWFSDHATRASVAKRLQQPALVDNFRDLRDVFERWQASNAKQDPTAARCCAMKMGTLTPVPRVADVLVGVTQSPRVATKLFAAAVLQQSLSAMRDELLKESNRKFACAQFRRALLCPEACEKRGAWLERARHLPRSVLWELLRTAGLTLSPRTPVRVLDLMFREVMCPEMQPRLLLWATELGSHKLRLVLLRDKLQDTIKYARQTYLEQGFQEPSSCEELVDKLLEHGCLWLLDSLSAQERAELEQSAGCVSGSLEARLREALSAEFLESWLRDRGIAFSPQDPVQTLLEKYRAASFGCLFGQGACPDPDFPRWLKPKPGPSNPQAEAQPAHYFHTALRLFTFDFNAQDREDRARLSRMLSLLECDEMCGDSKCEDEELASRVATKLLSKLETDAGRAALCALLGIPAVESQRGVQQRLQELSQRNRHKISQLRKASVLLKLVSAAQQGSLGPQLEQLNLGKTETEQQARALTAQLVEDYVSREYFLRVARLQLARPVTDDEPVLTILTGPTPTQ
jgi:hypothetical protein